MAARHTLRAVGVLGGLLVSAGAWNARPGAGAATSSADFVLLPDGLNAPRGILYGPGTVTFRNEDAVVHRIAFGAHPLDADCGGLRTPVLKPGERAAVPLGAVTACSFHDEFNPGNAAFHGVVTVSAPAGDETARLPR